MSQLVRTLAVVGGAAIALCAAAVVAQPSPMPQPKDPEPKVNPGVTWWDNDYTAFPELAPPPGVGAKHAIPGVERLAAAVNDVPKDATPLRKVQIAQLRAGYSCLVRTQMKIERGQFTSGEYQNYLRLVVAMYRVGAEMTNDPAEKPLWVEDQVRLLREWERFTAARVPNIDPPQVLDEARFWRLAAEAELLRARAAVPPRP
jgi:hypothetical protein